MEPILYNENNKCIDISTEFCGIKFPNPFVLASGPPTAYGSMIKRAFDMGWGGAVLKTLKPDSMNIVDVKPRFDVIRGNHGEIVGFENIELVSKRPLSTWLKEIKEIKMQYANRILIASIMAEVDKKAWQELAKKVADAGVDALELNFSCPHGMPEMGIGAAIGQNEKLVAEITSWVKQVVNIPVFVKLTPNVTDIICMAKAAQNGGADGIAAINTVQCLIGINLDTMEPLPSVDGYSTYGGYSGLAVKPIGLRAVSQIAKNIDLPIFGIGGISSWEHAVEYLLLGASSVQICTAVMIKGYGIIINLIEGLERYMQNKNIKTISELKGKSLDRIKDHSVLSVAKRVVQLKNELCIRCGECVRVCCDAGYDALKLEKKQLIIDYEKCDGCSLCTIICPQKALSFDIIKK
jgi:dihydropyrimidine dehydrogenase (NAD+) subunit PreA